MRKKIALTSAALMVLLLSTASANAISLTIGGGGLVSVDGSADTSSSSGVGVDVDLGGTDSSASVDANLDVDMDVDGDANLALFGGKKLVTTGGDHLVTVDTGEDSDALITLFGSSGGSTGATVNLGSGSANDGVVASADLGGTDDPVLFSLFGAGSDDGGSGVVVSSDPLFGSRTISVFEADGGAGGGSPAAAGGAAGDGSTIFEDGDAMAPAPAMPSRLAPRTAARVASNANVRTGGSCFSPDDQQIANLRARTTYDGSVVASWKSASNISIVPINLCPEAKVRLAAEIDADANIEYLQAAVAADMRLNASLDPSYDPEDVLAIDKAGDDLIIYVY